MTPSIDSVIAAVCEVTGIRRDVLIGRDRHRPVVQCRQAAMAAAAQVTHKSLPSIGRAFNRDHTTALYATRRCDADADLRRLRDKIAEFTLAAFMHNWVEAVPFRSKRPHQ